MNNYFVDFTEHLNLKKQNNKDEGVDTSKRENHVSKNMINDILK